MNLAWKEVGHALSAVGAVYVRARAIIKTKSD
jgi:hypothetical protein